jgi:hypothetical protein
MTIGEFLSFLKESSPVTMFVVAWGTAVLMFCPESGLSHLGVLPLRNRFAAWIGLSLIISVGYLVGFALKWTANPVGNFFTARRIKRHMLRRLEHSTADEKKCLSEFVKQNQRTLPLPWNNCTVITLENDGILSRPKVVDPDAMPPKYQINEIAWRILHKQSKWRCPVRS